jgi:hypothetical protein
MYAAHLLEYQKDTDSYYHLNYYKHAVTDCRHDSMIFLYLLLMYYWLDIIVSDHETSTVTGDLALSFKAQTHY